jgi:hypothetical protein
MRFHVQRLRVLLLLAVVPRRGLAFAARSALVQLPGVALPQAAVSQVVFVRHGEPTLPCDLVCYSCIYLTYYMQ